MEHLSQQHSFHIFTSSHHFTVSFLPGWYFWIFLAHQEIHRQSENFCMCNARRRNGASQKAALHPASPKKQRKHCLVTQSYCKTVPKQVESHLRGQQKRCQKDQALPYLETQRALFTQKLKASISSTTIPRVQCIFWKQFSGSLITFPTSLVI